MTGKNDAGSTHSRLLEVTRHVKESTRLELVAASGGRCEFLGCNTFLFAHSVTKTGRYFGNTAHIRAFSPGGPRAGTPEERADLDLNAIENLMLLCQECHTLVDGDEGGYPIEKLRGWKRAHEERATYLLDLPAENEACVFELWTSLSNQPVVRSQAKIVAALLPLYPSKVRSALINLAEHNLSDATLIPAAKDLIDIEVARIFGPTGERPTHVAVFGLTNIPLLAYLGAKLGDRQDVKLFQLHRDTKDWKWKDEPASAEYSVENIRAGTSKTSVALLLSLSGTIDPESLPDEIDGRFSIYEIKLVSDTPNRDFLRTLGDLSRFREVYRKFLSDVQEKHGTLSEIEVIPAVPIPVAVALGMDRLAKVHPALQVHDLDRNAGDKPTYQRVLRVP